ncbi:unnamed protein product [Periconia digitata]|uniref:Uncharacterized protein n=1 Tax=Periconia digitata TaxID=1303443 RepID=A0A9W4XT48_9PLEO|nr:unnamed protein product [Periconia digitata]
MRGKKLPNGRESQHADYTQSKPLAQSSSNWPSPRPRQVRHGHSKPARILPRVLPVTYALRLKSHRKIHFAGFKKTRVRGWTTQTGNVRDYLSILNSQGKVQDRQIVRRIPRSALRKTLAKSMV